MKSLSGAQLILRHFFILRIFGSIKLDSCTWCNPLKSELIRIPWLKIRVYPDSNLQPICRLYCSFCLAARHVVIKLFCQVLPAAYANNWSLIYSTTRFDSILYLTHCFLECKYLSSDCPFLNTGLGSFSTLDHILNKRWPQRPTWGWMWFWLWKDNSCIACASCAIRAKLKIRLNKCEYKYIFA